jgi:hypothetical protein
MKLLISLAVLLSSSTLLAAEPTCPENTDTLYTCVSTPQKGDDEVASGIFEAITICQDGAKYLMVAADQHGPSDPAEVSADVRMGGSKFYFVAEDTEFSLSVATGMAQKATTAKFMVKLVKMGRFAASTYSCK